MLIYDAIQLLRKYSLGHGIASAWEEVKGTSQFDAIADVQEEAHEEMPSMHPIIILLLPGLKVG